MDYDQLSYAQHLKLLRKATVPSDSFTAFTSMPTILYLVVSLSMLKPGLSPTYRHFLGSKDICVFFGISAILAKYRYSQFDHNFTSHQNLIKVYANIKLKTKQE